MTHESLPGPSVELPVQGTVETTGSGSLCGSDRSGEYRCPATSRQRSPSSSATRPSSPRRSPKGSPARRSPSTRHRRNLRLVRGACGSTDARLALADGDRQRF